jgi:hypothetical protein
MKTNATSNENAKAKIVTKPSGVVEINGVTCGAKGLRFNGRYIPVWYSNATLTNGKTAITIYAKSYCHSIPKELGNVQNDSDMMTDYHEKDKTRFYLGSAEYAALLKFAK